VSNVVISAIVAVLNCVAPRSSRAGLPAEIARPVSAA
jgi:hypothetical protein